MLHFDKDFLGLEQWGKNLQSSTVIFVAAAVCRAHWAAGQHAGQLGSWAATHRAGQNL